MPTIEELIAKGDAQFKKTAPPAAPAPQESQSRSIEDLLALGDRRLHAAPAPVAAPTGQPPVLPPTTVATPGILPPSSAAPVVTPPAPPKPAPTYLAPGPATETPLAAHNMRAQQKGIKPTAADANAILGETGIDVAAFPPPTGPVPRYKPLAFPKSPTAEAEARLSQAEAKLKKIPAYMQGAFQEGHGPIAPEKAYQGAEGGPVSRLREAHGTASRDVGAAALRAHGQALSLANEATSRLNSLIEYANKNGGSLSNKEQTDLAGQIKQANIDYQKAQQNYSHIDKLAHKFQPYVEKYATTPPHSGMYYPEEVGADQQGPSSGAAGHAIAGLMFPNAGAHTEEYLRNRVALMLSGQYPKLPPPPKGMALTEAIRQKNSLLNLLHTLRVERAAPGGLNQPLAQERQQLVQALTPWQRQLLPVVEKQEAAEELAAKGRSKALAIDVAAQTAGALTGHVAGGLVSRTLGRIAAGRGTQLLEQAIQEAYAQGGAKQAAKSLAARGAAGAVSGSVSGGTFGATAAGVGTLLQTGNVKEAGKAAGRSFGPSALIGGGFGVAGALAGDAAAGARSFVREVRKHTGDSFDPVRSPYIINEMTDAYAHTYGLSPAESGALKQRLVEIAKAPGVSKNKMWQGLISDLKTSATARGMTPQPTPKAVAALPSAEPVEVGGTLPGEKPVTSPTGVAGGFIGPTLAGRPLRQMSAAELEQTRQQAVASGDTATAARAQQGLDLHAKHQAANQPLPLEEAKAYLKDRDRPGNVPIAQARTIASHAAAIEKVNPDLAARLQQAADDYEQTWKNDWLSVGGKVLTTPEAAAPPQVSVWRQLDPTEKSSLPASVKQALLVQDVHNSQQALTPGAPAIFKPADVPGKPKSPKALEATADQMFGQAEAHLDSTLPAPVAETPAATPMPGPAPAEPAPLPQESLSPAAPVERRTESGAAQRKAIGDITDLGEARAEIERARAETAESERKRLLHPLTEMPNLSAYNEAPRKAYQGEVDADSLKWWNDEFANEAGDAGGDALLKNVGQALQKAGLEAYHIKGDEFVAQGDDPHELAARLELANRILQGSTVQFETLGGETRSFTGAQMTYGVGETLAKGNPYGKANAELKRLKLEKEASGERAARGERPPGVVEVGAKAGAPQGQQELAGRPASGQPDRGVEEGAGAGVTPTRESVIADAVKAARGRKLFDAPPADLLKSVGLTHGDLYKAINEQLYNNPDTGIWEKRVAPSGSALKPAQEGQPYYHGFRDTITQKFEPVFPDYNSNLFGDGLYLTDDPAVAEKYAKKGTARVAIPKDAKLLSMDEPLPKEVAEAWGEPSLAGNNAGEAWKDLEHDIHGPSGVFEAKAELTSALMDLGYDGITHKGNSRGGWRQGGNNATNNVVIYFKPETLKPYRGEASYNASDLHANPKRGEMPVRFTETESGVPLAVTDKLAAALDKHPEAEVLARYIEENAPRLKAVIDKVIQKALSPEEAARVEQSGLGLLEWNGPAFGANFYDSGNPAGPVAIYVNPFRTEEQVVSRTWYPSRSGGDNSRKLAQDFVNTALHEAAHNLERQEGESHWQVMDRLYDAAGGERTFNPLVEEVQDVITQGNPGGELSPEYRAGRQVYLEATRSAGSTRSTDVLRSAAGGRQTPGANLARRVSKGQSVPGQPGRGNSGVPKVAPIRTGTEVDRIFDEGYVPPKIKDEDAPNPVELFINSFTRQFPHLPETAEHIELKNLLTDQERSKGLAQGKAIRHVEKVFHSLHPQEVKNFSHVMYVKDLEQTLDHFIEQWVEAKKDPKDFDATQFLPDGINEHDVRTAAKAVDQILKDQPHLNSLAIKLRTLRKDIVDPWLDNYEAVFGRRPKLDNPWYVRHVVRTALGETGIPSGAGPGLASKSLSPLKGRVGTQLLHASNIVESEMDVIQRVVRHDLRLQLVRHLQDNYDKMPVYMLAQSALKDPDFAAAIARTAQTGVAIPALHSWLGRVASDEMAPDLLNGKYSQAIADLHIHYDLNAERAANGLQPLPMDADAEARVVDYVKWLHGQIVKHGKVGAQIPKGYQLVDVTGLPTYYQAYTINERLAREAIEDGLTELNVPVDKIRKVLAVGRRRQMLLPDAVARTLKGQRFGEPDPVDTILRSVAKAGMGKMKFWLIYGPQNYVSQMVRNGVGDTLRILRNAPGMVARIDEGRVRSAWGEAFKDLADNRVMFKPPSPELEKFYDLGGEEALHYAAENLSNPHPLSPASQHLGKSSPVKKLGAVAQWAYLLPHDFREQWGRYAVYRYILDGIKKTGKPPVIGSAKAEQALAIKDPHEQAFFIANHIVGAYNQRSAGTKLLRSFPLPFFSFQEINASGIYQEMKNRINAPDVAHSLGRQWIGEGRIPNWMSRELTRGAALFNGLLGLGLFTGGIWAWNRLQHPKEQKELERTMPGEAVVIAGPKDPNTGDIPIYRGMDPVRDLADKLLGVSVAQEERQDLVNGRKTPQEFILDMTVKNWANQLYQQLNPAMKPYDIAGYSTFPNVFERRPNKITADAIWDQAGLGGVYRYLNHVPMKRGYARKLATGQNTVNPLELSYWQAQDGVRNWQERVGKKPPEIGGVATDDPQVQALYWVKQAERLGDRAGAIFWLGKYARAQQGRAEGSVGGSLKTLQNAMEGLDPLHSVSDKDLVPYLRQLKPEEAWALRRAYLFYHNLVAPEMGIHGMENISTASFVRRMRGMMKGAIMRSEILKGAPEGGALKRLLRKNEAEARKRLPVTPDESGASGMNAKDLEDELTGAAP
jgi:hypothetical protein